MSIDDVLNQIQARLGLEAETEHEVLEEIRGHLEEAVAAAKARGLDEEHALHEAAAAFAVEQAAGALDGVATAALPVSLAVLRWLIFTPDGTADAWRETLSLPSLAIIAAIAMLVPLLRFPRRCYALTLWIFFWGLSLLTVLWPTVRW